MTVGEWSYKCPILTMAAGEWSYKVFYGNSDGWKLEVKGVWCWQWQLVSGVKRCLMWQVMVGERSYKVSDVTSDGWWLELQGVICGQWQLVSRVKWCLMWWLVSGVTRCLTLTRCNDLCLHFMLYCKHFSSRNKNVIHLSSYSNKVLLTKKTASCWNLTLKPVLQTGVVSTTSHGLLAIL